MVIGLLGAGQPAAAQEVEAGQTWFTGFIGGLTDNLGFTIGAGIDHSLSERVVFAADLGYLSVTTGSSGFAVNANGHYLFRLPDAPEFTPYALGGLGFGRVGGGGFSDSTVGVNVGGGLRWQAHDRWGVRPELKVLISDFSHVRFSVALFYLLGD